MVFLNLTEWLVVKMVDLLQVQQRGPRPSAGGCDFAVISPTKTRGFHIRISELAWFIRRMIGLSLSRIYCTSYPLVI